MKQHLPYAPGGAMATPFHIVSAMLTSHVPEGVLVDGKEQEGYRSGCRKEFLKDVCSFANAQGGMIVIGMKELAERGRWHAVGVDDTGALCSRLRDWLGYLIPPGVPGISMEVIPGAGKEFLIIQIPRAPIRPVCFHDAVDSACELWIRDADRNRPLRFEEIREAFLSRRQRQSRWGRSVETLLRRFDDAPSCAREVRLQAIVGSVTELDIGEAGKANKFGELRSCFPGTLSDPIILPYDQDMADAFGSIPEGWIHLGPDGAPQAIRLPGSTVCTLLRGGTVEGAKVLETLLTDAGQLLAEWLVDEHAFRHTISKLNGRVENPLSAWVMHLALESFRLSEGDPLKCQIRSWVHNYTFDYESVFGDDFHAPFAHLVSTDGAQKAALRRFRIEFPGDACLSSAVAISEMLHRVALL